MEQLISSNPLLKGYLSDTSSKLNGSISSPSGISGSITAGDGQLHDIYNGETEVNPSTKSDKVLLTKDKLLVEDIRVKKIEYVETSNLSNGVTVYIGVD